MKFSYSSLHEKRALDLSVSGLNAGMTIKSQAY